MASAGKFLFPAPGATATVAPHRVTIALRGSEHAEQMFLVVPKTAGLKAVGIGDCRDATVTLDIGSTKPFDILSGERRFGLPSQGKKLLEARPNTAVPSQLGDGTILFSKLRIED